MAATRSDAAGSSAKNLPEHIARLFDRITEISSLPQVASQIIDLVDDPDSDIQDLVDLVRRDPSLAMRLMRTVNSSYYGLRAKVSDLDQAAALLGFAEIRNLALTVYVVPMFRDKFEYGSYTRLGLWTHMIAAAIVAQRIVETCKGVSRQEAYLAGLLHDVGLILIDQYVHGRFCRILDALGDEAPLHELEQGILGFDHAMLGAYVAARWNLPERLAAAIEYHHTPEQYDGPHRQLLDAITLADYLCHRKGLAPLGAGKVQALPPALFDGLGLTRERTAAIVDQLDDVLVVAQTFAGAQLGASL